MLGYVSEKLLHRYDPPISFVISETSKAKYMYKTHGVCV